MATYSGSRNPFWKGGRSVASNGYVLIRVGTEHHLSDVRGYAYEHRVVAEKKLGRRLLRGEQVHHVDGNKSNNSPENLEAKEDTAHHRVHHRKAGKALKLPDESNPTVQCLCGCCSEFPKYDQCGRPRRFVSGHNSHVRSEDIKP